MRGCQACGVVFCGISSTARRRERRSSGGAARAPADASGRSPAGHRRPRPRAGQRPRHATSSSVLGVTDETIRRDLARLAELGVVRRAHGGAVAAPARRRDRHGVPPPGARQPRRSRSAGARPSSSRPGARSSSTPARPRCASPGRSAGKRDLVVVTTAVTNALELVGNPGHDRRS